MSLALSIALTALSAHVHADADSLAAAAIVDGVTAALHTLTADETGAKVDFDEKVSAVKLPEDLGHVRNSGSDDGGHLRIIPPPLMPKKVLFGFSSIASPCCSVVVSKKSLHRRNIS